MKKLPSRKNNRLKEYDYSENGYYYVTICSKDRQNIFAKINISKIVGAGLASARDNNPAQMQLTQIGQIVQNQWIDIPNQCHNVDIDTFIIMPNHIHGIIIINNRDEASPSPTNLGQIICSFKSKCTNKYLNFITQNNLDKSSKIWQRNYYDHIIRNDKSLQEVREYIINNPATWADDENNIEKPKTL